ncbi:hypothetical protein K435DRAFT_815902 [Dendrothele bispora CBS 962.96]|uniref:CENP-V/GFA domain-containing protein n=1 Tax=Dendrothele bispora (strain CBS 962.96) TaxID=1314807 RepID=A0A4S8MTV2_DENBC|nr:hypothetical protein K435DRAFT_815902 [Dendrothele bispora CBS 962.96]
MDTPVYQGSCFCGKVTYEVMGKPLISAYCHCTLCQRLHSSAFIHTVHFSETSFKWTCAESCESVTDTYPVAGKPWKMRYRCKECGATVASHNSKANNWSIRGAQLERDETGKIKAWDELKPTAHMFYGTRMLDINDDLGKWEGYENQSKKIS